MEKINPLKLSEQYANEQWPTPYGKKGSKEYNRWYLNWRSCRRDYLNGLLAMQKLLKDSQPLTSNPV